MKAGITLEQLAAEITRQSQQKEDYLVNTRNLEVEPIGSDITLHLRDGNGSEPVEPLGINSIAHQQIGTHLGIPSRYYQKMQEEDPALLAQNINAWMQKNPSDRMVRTLDGTARAYLSNRYRRIDNMEIAKVVLPIIGQMQGVRVESCQLTESRMYIKVVNPRLEAEVAVDDIVQSGVIISNSETGQGAVSIQPLVFRLVCSNGMVINDASTRRNHIGRVNTADDNFTLYSDKTLAADDHAFVLKIQDTVKVAVDEVRFAKVIDLMKNASQVKLDTSDVPGIVRLASKEFRITEAESDGVLQHLIEGHDLSLYGLANAVTRFSQDVESYDRSTELESIGYNILTMPKRVFNRLNQAA